MPGPMFVSSGAVGASFPAHEGYPATSTRGYGGGRQAAMQMARNLLVQRLRSASEGDS